MDGAPFRAYVEQWLCPQLVPGDIVIGDNLSCRKVSDIKEAIEATGSTIL